VNITKEQADLLKKYGVAIFDEINDVLLALDAKITEVGFDANYNLNDTGLKLQRLYDELFDQN
jgi:hypothetical protein